MAVTLSIDRLRPVLTVRDLLSHPTLRGVRLLTEPTSSLDAMVRTASVQEVPVEDFVRESELVLTTAMGDGAIEERLARIVRQVKSSNASALAVAVPGYVDSVPESALRLADELDLPILELPWQVRFSEVLEMVFRHALESEMALVRRSEAISGLLTDAVLRGSDSPQLCQLLSEMLQRGVRLRDRWGDELAMIGQRGTTEAWETFEVRAGNRTIGQVEVEVGSKALDPADRSAVAHGVTSAGLVLLVEEAAQNGVARGRSDLLAALLHGWIDSLRDVELRAGAIGLRAEAAHIVACVEIGPNDAEAHRECVDDVRWAIQRASHTRRIPVFSMWADREVSIVVEGRHGQVESACRVLLADVRALVERRHPDADLTLGIGRTVETLSELPASFRDARTALRLGAGMKGPGSLTTYRDLGAYPALYATSGVTGAMPVLDDLVMRWLGPILEYERRTGLQLVRTLEVLFEQNGNVSAAARSLEINRQSLLYRLAKIESLAEVDLHSASDRFALELALRLNQVTALKTVRA